VNSVSTKTGADYQRFEDRLPTLRLTDAEILALQTTALRILDSGEIRWNHLEDALGEVFGPDAIPGLIDALRNRTPVAAWSRRDTVRLIAALYPYIPGETEGKKAAWVVDQAQPCFDADRWDAEIFPFVLQRIEEYRAAGGTLDRWPDVVEPPEPAAPRTLTGAERGFLWKPLGDHADIVRVLLPPEYTGLVDRGSVEIWHAGQLVERLRSTGVANGGREHFAGAKPGGAYNACSQVRATAQGVTFVWVISSPGSRNEDVVATVLGEPAT
jgi:hypothetical protein